MQPPYDLNAERKPANLTVNADLLRRARAQKINLSATLERALVEDLRRRQSEQWLQNNRQAIAVYNAEVEKQGVFSDGLRAF